MLVLVGLRGRSPLVGLGGQLRLGLVGFRGRLG